MDYKWYICYHNQGDAGVEERMIASLCKYYKLDEYQSFCLIYFYTMTYDIPSTLDMLFGERDKSKLKFRTDRRYVRCHGAFERLLAELNPEKFNAVRKCKTTTEAYNVVKSWYYFGRYASFLFLEVYMNVFQTNWVDNLKFNWESDENYTKGAVLLCGTSEKSVLDNFLENAKKDTRDNCFAIETSLCAVEKIRKGTRWNGYYTERMINDCSESKYANIILSLAD